MLRAIYKKSAGVSSNVVNLTLQSLYKVNLKRLHFLHWPKTQIRTLTMKAFLRCVRCLRCFKLAREYKLCQILQKNFSFMSFYSNYCAYDVLIVYSDFERLWSIFAILFFCKRHIFCLQAHLLSYFFLASFLVSLLIIGFDSGLFYFVWFQVRPGL